MPFRIWCGGNPSPKTNAGRLTGAKSLGGRLQLSIRASTHRYLQLQRVWTPIYHLNISHSLRAPHRSLIVQALAKIAVMTHTTIKGKYLGKKQLRKMIWRTWSAYITPKCTYLVSLRRDSRHLAKKHRPKFEAHRKKWLPKRLSPQKSASYNKVINCSQHCSQRARKILNLAARYEFKISPTRGKTINLHLLVNPKKLSKVKIRIQVRKALIKSSLLTSAKPKSRSVATKIHKQNLKVPKKSKQQNRKPKNLRTT